MSPTQPGVAKATCWVSTDSPGRCSDPVLSLSSQVIFLILSVYWVHTNILLFFGIWHRYCCRIFNWLLSGRFKKFFVSFSMHSSYTQKSDSTQAQLQHWTLAPQDKKNPFIKTLALSTSLLTVLHISAPLGSCASWVLGASRRQLGQRCSLPPATGICLLESPWLFAIDTDTLNRTLNWYNFGRSKDRSTTVLAKGTEFDGNSVCYGFDL